MSDVNNDVLGQFSVADVASLAASVAVIVALGAKEEMVWIAAQTVVAVMAYAHAVWDWTVRQFVSKAVSLLANATVAQYPSAFFVGVTSPTPASVLVCNEL